MKAKKMELYIAAGAVLALLLLSGFTGANSLFMQAEDLIISFEGFVGHPYWDYKQYSWGYGTKAPGPSGTITPEQARAELHEHLQGDYTYLSQLIHVPLSAGQWAALLSFSYNLGTGNADNLVDNINAENNAALGEQWLKYIYAGGVVNDGLVKRRAAEWRVWNA